MCHPSIGQAKYLSHSGRYSVGHVRRGPSDFRSDGIGLLSPSSMSLLAFFFPMVLQPSFSPTPHLISRDSELEERRDDRHRRAARAAEKAMGIVPNPR